MKEYIITVKGTILRTFILEAENRTEALKLIETDTLGCVNTDLIGYHLSTAKVERLK